MKFFYEHYDSPLGEITMASEGSSLTGLWFSGQKYFGAGMEGALPGEGLPVFSLAKKWLDTYFRRERPDFSLPLLFLGTDFRKVIWQQLLTIPYGKTVTYGEIAKNVAKVTGRKIVSPRAVGQAVGHNPIGIIVPCHRVLGAGGRLTGYAGGLDKKLYLLELEGVVCNED